MNEFGLIQQYFSDLQDCADGVVLGIGDDAAVLQLSPDEQLVVATDTMVEGVHFPADLDGEHVASRALASNLSDLAAMGAEPRWFTLALTLPELNKNWLASFSQGLSKLARRYRCALVGGDTTRGPLTVTITVHGMVPTGEAIRRAGANLGERLFVSGIPGMGAAGLACLQGDITGITDASRQQLLSCFINPQPRLQLGEQLRTIASAAIDISDGLVADLGHICQRSGVGAKIYLDALQKLPWPTELKQDKRLLPWTLAGGDDYELCFAVPPERIDALAALPVDLPLTEIGEVVVGEAVQVIDANNQVVPVAANGYQHF